MDSASSSSKTIPVQALPQSKLGTKDHWDSVYQREVQAYSEIGDEGEVWFGDSSVKRMRKYLSKKLPTLYDIGENPCRVLDLGCGNGHLLFSILGSKSPEDDEEDSSEEEEDRSEDEQDSREENDQGRKENGLKNPTTPIISTSTGLTKPQFCLGIDYSELSIALAREISLRRGGGCEKVRFEISDLMQDDQVENVRKFSMDPLDGTCEREEGWDLVCDKGTLDAIALSSLENPIPNYSKAVKRLTRSKGGLFMITSCNFTEQELTQIFTDSREFEIESVVPTPSFSFGGQKGSTTTTMVFRRI